MSASEDNTRPISVAELLARNGTIGAPPVGGRGRRRRRNADTRSVAELTGEIPVVRTDAVPPVNAESDVEEIGVEEFEADGGEAAAEVSAEEVSAEEVSVEEIAGEEIGAEEIAAEETAVVEPVGDASPVEARSAETVVIYASSPDAVNQAAEFVIHQAVSEDFSGELSEELSEDVIEELSEEPVEEPAEEPLADLAEEPAEEPLADLAEEPAEEPVEASVDDAVVTDIAPPPPRSPNQLPSRRGGPQRGYDPRPARRASGAERMAPDPVVESVDLAALVEESGESVEELRSYLQSSGGTLFSGETVADDLARGGVPAEAVAAVETPTAQQASQGAGGLLWQGLVAVLQSLLAVAFGAGLFVAFDQLWRWNNIVALVLSVLVILGLVVAVRLVRKTEDIASTLIAVAVGAMVTLGPLALLQST